MAVQCLEPMPTVIRAWKQEEHPAKIVPVVSKSPTLVSTFDILNKGVNDGKLGPSDVK